MFWNKLLTYDWHKIAYWLVATGIILFVAIVMTIIGLVWLKSASKRYNCFYGYRTSLSKRDDKTWIYANRTAGRVLLIAGAVMFVVSAIVMLLCMHGPYEEVTVRALILCILEILTTICCHFYIRTKIKRRINDTQ